MQGNEIRNELPKEWLENRKKGLCPVCGKTRDEFNKGKRVYCSDECQRAYYEKITTWQNLRDEFLDEHGVFCDKCGVDRDEFEKKRTEAFDEYVREFARTHIDEIEDHRASLLKQAEEYYKHAQDDMRIAKDIVSAYAFDNEYGCAYFEVDHIVPTAAGGAKWDKSNLQVLCSRCHKEKTKGDMKLIRKNGKAVTHE